MCVDDVNAVPCTLCTYVCIAKHALNVEQVSHRFMDGEVDAMQRANCECNNFLNPQKSRVMTSAIFTMRLQVVLFGAQQLLKNKQKIA